MLDIKVKDEIINRLIDASPPEKIIVFGSYCRGTQKTDSDVDLFIIQKTDASPFTRSTVFRKALLDMGLSFDIIVRTPEEVNQWRDVKNSFINTILTEGKVIYERQASAH